MYNEERVLNSHWDAVANLMDDEKREQVHRELDLALIRSF